jgi:hypothetical protein
VEASQFFWIPDNFILQDQGEILEQAVMQLVATLASRQALPEPKARLP